MQLIRKIIWDISIRFINFPGKERLIGIISRPKEHGQIEIMRENVKFRIRGHDLNEFVIAIRKNHSPLLSKALIKEIQNNNVQNFWDIGANIGAISLPLLKKFKQLNAVLFEPSAEVCGRLIKNLSLNSDLFDRTSIMNFALSNSNGLAKFYVSNEDFNSGVAGLGASDNREKFSVCVQTYSGDDFLELAGLKPPTLIKIDVEGYELEVLQGLEKTLLLHSPTIIFEHSQYRFIERGQEKDLVINYLKSLGYAIYNLANNSQINERDLDIDSDFIARKS